MFFALSLGFGIMALGLVLTAFVVVTESRRLQQRYEAVLTFRGTMDADLVDEFVDEELARIPRLLRPISEPIAALFPKEMRQKARTKLTNAGMLSYLGEADFMLFRVVSAVTGVAGALFFFNVMIGRSLLQAVAGAVLVLVIGVLLPDYWLQTRVNARQHRIRKTLPDILDLLVVSVEAGTGFDAAMSHVEGRFPGPVADEFGRVLQEMRLGKSRAACLRDMAERTGVQEVSVFVSAICLADQLGVSMAQVLRVQSETLRQKRIFQIRELAQKLPVKMLFPLVFFIFPAIFVVIAGPGVIRIYEALVK